MPSLSILGYLDGDRKRKGTADSSTANASNENEVLLHGDGKDGHEPQEAPKSEGSLDKGQQTLPFGPPPKRKKPTYEELVERLGPDHDLFKLETQCFPNCDCYFCQLTEGLIER